HVPDQEHYACLIDLLGRAWHFDEVLGTVAIEHLIELELQSSVGYVFLTENSKASRANKFVITDEYFQWVTQALMMRLRQYKEIVAREGTRIAEMRREDLIFWEVGISSQSEKIMNERDVRKYPGVSWLEIENRYASYMYERDLRKDIQHEEIVVREGTGLARMRQRDLIQWYVGQQNEKNNYNFMEEAKAEVFKIKAIIDVIIFKFRM
nr:DNA replication licensing factor MCM6 [Tanacetum cinerariifolium]